MQHHPITAADLANHSANEAKSEAMTLNDFLTNLNRRVSALERAVASPIPMFAHLFANEAKQDVPPSYGTNVSPQGDAPLAGVQSYGNLATGGPDRFVHKDVHDRTVAELEHSKAAHANCQELVASLQARVNAEVAAITEKDLHIAELMAHINGDAAKLGEKDHRIIAQEQRIRELEEALHLAKTPYVGHETPVDDPNAQWIRDAIMSGRQGFDAGISADDWFARDADTLGSLLAGYGYDGARLTYYLSHENHKWVVKPDMARDHRNAAWIFQALQQGYDRGYRKDEPLDQRAIVDNQLFQFGYQRGLAQRKVDKRQAALKDKR